MTKVSTIKTDPEFDMLIQPYIGPALVTQKKKLRKNKDLRYIDVYNNSLIMDTQKLCVLQTLNYEYKIKNHDFADKDAACLAICITQLSRTDLTTSYRKFLIGREFHYRQQVQKNMHLAKADTKCRIATTIGQQYSLASASIYRYSSFSEALTNIYINDPALAKEILMDICTISLGNIVELSRLKTDELHAVSKAYFSADQHKITHDFIRFEAMQRYNTSDKNPVDHEKEKILNETLPAIRKMPVYDPDAEVNSLCLTIRYWITSMQRVNNKTNLERVTSRARIKLIKELSYLQNTTEELQKSLVERK